METDSGITQMTELIKKDTERVVSIFHMFKKVEEWTSMLNADTEDIKKHKSNIYNVWNEKHIGWDWHQIRH